MKKLEGLVGIQVDTDATTIREALKKLEALQEFGIFISESVYPLYLVDEEGTQIDEL